MRKLIETIAFDENLGKTMRTIAMLEKGVRTVLSSEELYYGKYTAEEGAKINRINHSLYANDMPLMSNEEADWSVDRRPDRK